MPIRPAIAVIALLVALAFSSGAGAAVFAYTGSITSADADSQGVLNTGGADSSCAAEGNSPGAVNTSSSYNYDAYSFTNTSASTQCVSVSVSNLCDPVTILHGDLVVVGAYSSFNPADPGANYLGSIGGGFCGTTARSFSFDVAAGASFQVVLFEGAPGDGVQDYGLNVSGTGISAQSTAVRVASMSATRSPQAILVRWRTASEVDTLGFHVYRQVNGKRVRANRTLIAAKGSGGYSFRDRRAPKGKSITRYWIQEVALDGSRSWHGPVRVGARST